jgi:hypothetical protein
MATIVLMDRTRARLHGIDAPERDQPYGPIATAALENMVARSVYLVEVDEDRYGRLVGQLYRSKEGYDINASKKAMTSTLQWSVRGMRGGMNATHRIVRCWMTVRSRHSRHRKVCGKTEIRCRRGSGEESNANHIRRSSLLVLTQIEDLIALGTTETVGGEGDAGTIARPLLV